MSSLADLPEIVGFFSYSREDDEASDGSLSALRLGVQRELSAQLGRSRRTFHLWQDQEAIAPGRLWESEIRAAVEQAVFFIPIVTPRAVNSHYCKFEFEAFLARQSALGRTDLVFPLLYIRVPALENEAEWRKDTVLSIVGSRQYVDWRRFRHADVRTPSVREAIQHFCEKIVEALREPWVSPEERRKEQDIDAEQRAEQEARQAAAARQAEGEKRRGEANLPINTSSLISEGDENNQLGIDEPPWIRITSYLHEQDVDAYMNELYGLMPPALLEPFTLLAQGDDDDGHKALHKIALADGTPTDFFLSPRIHAFRLVQFKIKSLALSRLEIDDSDAIWQWNHDRNGTYNPHSKEIQIHFQTASAPPPQSTLINRLGCLYQAGKNGFVYLDRRFLESYASYWFDFLGIPTDGMKVSWDDSHGIRADTENVYVQFFPSADTVAKDLLEKAGVSETVSVASLDLDKIYSKACKDSSGVSCF
jgi:hypothetical protein